MVHEASWNTLRLACKTLLKTLFSTASLLKVWWNSSVALPKNKGNSPPLVRNFGNFYLNTFPSSSYSFQSFFSPFHQMSCYRLEAAAGQSLLPLSREALVLLKAPEPLPGSAWWLPHQPGHSHRERTSVFSVLFGHWTPQRRTSLGRPFSRVPAWLNLNLHHMPQSSKVYILQPTAVPYGLPPVTVMSAGIAQHFPYLVLLPLDGLISTCVRVLCLSRKTWKCWILTPTSFLSLTPGHLKGKWTSHFSSSVPSCWLAACRTRLPCSQEEFALASFATGFSPALPHQSDRLWNEWPECCMLESTLYFTTPGMLQT